MRYFIFLALLQVGFVLAQDQPVPKPQPTGVLENPETPPPATTNTPPANPIPEPIPTEVVPVIPPALTETNSVPAVPLPMPRNHYAVILERDPFRLYVPKPVTNSPTLPPSLLASVRLTGMMKTEDMVKAFFEVRAAGGGSVPKYIALAEGSSSKDTNGLFQIEVQKIDYANRSVELKQGSVTQTLKMDFVSTSTNRPRTDVGPRPGGLGGLFGTPGSGTGGFGRPTGSSGTTGRDPRDSGSSKSNPSKSGITPIPTRGKGSKGSTSLPQKGTSNVAEAAFDKFVQTRLVESNVIPTQREAPQGQLSLVPPTDLPKGLQ